MANKRQNKKSTETEKTASFILLWQKTRDFAIQKKNTLLAYPWRKQAQNLYQKLRKTDYKLLSRQYWTRLKKFKFKKTEIYKTLRKLTRKLTDLPKTLLIGVPTFVVCYYIIGCLMAENIDVQTEYKPQGKHIPMLETPETMSFLLKREVDDKMWTPNLPPVFPAYLLDNMPNFQIGVIYALRDITVVMRDFNQNTDAQRQDIKKAAEFLSYAPTIWLMTKKDGLGLVPSSNAQYRKAAAELHKFGKDGVYYAKTEDLKNLLNKICKGLQKLAQKNENHQLEHDTDWFDTKSDDLFYHAKGYAFALWQTTKTLGSDFREIILAANAYTEWTYLVNSLKKAAELNPRFIRNAPPQSATAPNHLIMQNYYLLRAVSSAEKINNKLTEGAYAD